MNDLRKATITTLEVAEMMEVPHSDLLKKLEGRKDRKGYIQILSEGQMSVADYFAKASYVDAQGKERPCYQATKLGCDFLANKSTGEKGVIFTARYVKRFYEMEHKEAEKVYETKATSLGEVASFTKEMDRRLEKQGTAPWKICEAFKMVSEQFGIRLPDDFVKVPEYEQMELQLG
ncbi:Rha family transcriptional regulator [Lachnospiraceae bacterium 46-15]